MHTQTQTAIQQVEISNQEHHDNIIAFARVWLCNRMKAFTSEDFKADYYEAGNERIKNHVGQTKLFPL